MTFIPDYLEAWPEYLEKLQSIGVEVIHRPYYNSVAEDI